MLSPYNIREVDKELIMTSAIATSADCFDKKSHQLRSRALSFLPCLWEKDPNVTWSPVTLGAFHSTKNSEISGPKLNGTVKIPGKVFENLGIRFDCTLFEIWWNFRNYRKFCVPFAKDVGFSLSTEHRRGRTIRFPVCHTPKEQQYLFFGQNCGPPRWIASWVNIPLKFFSSILSFIQDSVLKCHSDFNSSQSSYCRCFAAL